MYSENHNCKPTVLISDDDEGVRKMVTSILSASGFYVLCASDGQQALWIAQNYKDQIDLLLSDVDMGPDLNGIQLARQLHVERPAMKILLMSGASLETEAQVEGCEFLRKPFLPEGLKRKVQSVLG
jgi:DNA-binding response OmpR family regulator